jgi:hypothetical protein
MTEKPEDKKKEIDEILEAMKTAMKALPFIMGGLLAAAYLDAQDKKKAREQDSTS